MAKRDLRPLRVIAALFGAVSAIPLAYALVALLLNILAHSSRRAFTVDLVFVLGLLVAGPVAVATTSLLFALRVRFAGGFHLAALGIAGVLGFLAAGFLALGGGGKELGAFVLALPFGVLSVVLTILVMVQSRGEKAS